MKKILSTLLAVLLMLQSVAFADTSIPDFLTEVYTNYTADYSISMTFDSSADIVALLEELEMPEEVSYYVDMKALLQTMLSYEGKMKLQADIDDNYEKIQMALTSESIHSIDVNSNLNVGVNAKLGMWLNMDFSNGENPVFDLVYSHPFLNKYLKISSADILDEESIALFKAVFKKEYIEPINKKAAELFTRYATIQSTGNKHTITMDNDSFTAYMDELMPYILGMMATVTGEEVDMSVFPSMKGQQLLGEGGLECTVTVQDGHAVMEEIKMDIELDISKLYTDATGEECEYNAKGKLDFTVEETVNISKIGSTTVEFPVLTAENSFTMADLEPDYSDIEYEEEYTPEYPVWLVWGESQTLPIIDGEIYVPLRRTLESAYEHSVVIDYANRVVTAKSEYFPEFGTLTLTIGSDKVYTDGTEHTIGNAFLIDNTTYVNSKLFCDVFGWELSSVQHDLMEDIYSYTFRTGIY